MFPRSAAMRQLARSMQTRKFSSTQQKQFTVEASTDPAFETPLTTHAYVYRPADSTISIAHESRSFVYGVPAFFLLSAGLYNFRTEGGRNDFVDFYQPKTLNENSLPVFIPIAPRSLEDPNVYHRQ